MRLVLLLLIAACAVPVLPPAASHGAGVVPVSAGDVAYWIAPTADGWSLVRRATDSSVSVIDPDAIARVFEQGAASIVVGDDVLVWGFSGDFTHEASLDVVRPDGTVSKLDLSHAVAGYQGLPLAETGGHLILADGIDGFDVLELATGAISSLDYERVTMRDAVVDHGATTALLGMCVTDDASFVGELDAAAPQSSPLREIAPVARDGTGPIVHDGVIYWIDRGDPGDAATVKRAALDGDPAVQPVAQLEGAPSAIAWAGDALWIAEADDRQLVRVTPASGHTEPFAVPYEPVALAALPDRLLVTAKVDAAGQTLTEVLEQPLP